MVAAIGIAWERYLLSWWQHFARAETICWVIRKWAWDEIRPWIAAAVDVDAITLVAAAIVDTRVAWLAWWALWARASLVVSPFPRRGLRNLRSALVIAGHVLRRGAVAAWVNAEWEGANPWR